MSQTVKSLTKEKARVLLPNPMVPVLEVTAAINFI